MSDCYVGEIRLLPYLRGAPSDWQVCDGSLLSIASAPLLYQLLGTTYGGDGSTTFGVPDLRGRVPVHQGASQGLTPRSLGQIGGTESVTLTTPQMGTHTHVPLASTVPATSNSPSSAMLAAIPSSLNAGYYNSAPSQAQPNGFPATTLQPGGGGQSHDNTAPTQVLQYCIALQGLWPAQP